jgi:crotonobetainyl-CoA:carnitine CoA-transferase CaiB-like acyl-CoA transferase
VSGAVLEGVRVLDFGRYIAGPWCAALLADFGADVIRIERVSGGDDRYQYPVTEKGEGACFLQMNRNKRGFTLNPMKSQGGEILRRLVSTANVVIVNLPADTRQQMGLDYDHLRSIKPDVILTAISAFGEEGPYGNRVGFDGIGQAMSGATYLSGLPGQPTKSYASWVDYSTAMFSAFGTLAAILEHRKTGRGQEVQTTLFGSAVTVFNFNLIEQALAKVNRVASGNRSQSSCPADISRTKDGYIQIQTVGHPLFERWVRLMGEPHWLEDPRFKTDDLRARNGEILSRRTHEWAANYTTSEALELLAKERIPAGPVYSPQNVLDDPHVQETRMLTLMEYPGALGPVPVSMSPIKMSATPSKLRMRPPMVGEHTHDIMLELGFSEAEIDQFKEERVI